MSDVDRLVDELSEAAILRISRRFDDAHMRYFAPSINIGTFQEFTDALANYIQYIYSSCISTGGGSISEIDAAGIAKEILINPRRGENMATVYSDCVKGRNGGLHRCLYTLCETLKHQAIERYTRDVFDRWLPPNRIDLKIRMVQEFIDKYRIVCTEIDSANPAYYASNIEELIQGVLHNLEQMANTHRRF